MPAALPSLFRILAIGLSMRAWLLVRTMQEP